LLSIQSSKQLNRNRRKLFFSQNNQMTYKQKILETIAENTKPEVSLYIILIGKTTKLQI